MSTSSTRSSSSSSSGTPQLKKTDFAKHFLKETLAVFPGLVEDPIVGLKFRDDSEVQSVDESEDGVSPPESKGEEKNTPAPLPPREEKKEKKKKQRDPPAKRVPMEDRPVFNQDALMENLTKGMTELTVEESTGDYNRDLAMGYAAQARIEAIAFEEYAKKEEEKRKEAEAKRKATEAKAVDDMINRAEADGMPSLEEQDGTPLREPEVAPTPPRRPIRKVKIITPEQRAVSIQDGDDDDDDEGKGEMEPEPEEAKEEEEEEKKKADEPTKRPRDMKAEADLKYKTMADEMEEKYKAHRLQKTIELKGSGRTPTDPLIIDQRMAVHVWIAQRHCKWYNTLTATKDETPFNTERLVEQITVIPPFGKLEDIFAVPPLATIPVSPASTDNVRRYVCIYYTLSDRFYEAAAKAGEDIKGFSSDLPDGFVMPIPKQCFTCLAEMTDKRFTCLCQEAAWCNNIHFEYNRAFHEKSCKVVEAEPERWARFTATAREVQAKRALIAEVKRAAQMAEAKAIFPLDMRVAQIIEVGPHKLHKHKPLAAKQWVVTVDFGFTPAEITDKSKRQYAIFVTALRDHYPKISDLINKRVVVALNTELKSVAGIQSAGLILLGVQSDEDSSQRGLLISTQPIGTRVLPAGYTLTRDPARFRMTEWRALGLSIGAESAAFVSVASDQPPLQLLANGTPIIAERVPPGSVIRF